MSSRINTGPVNKSNAGLLSSNPLSSKNAPSSRPDEPAGDCADLLEPLVEARVIELTEENERLELANAEMRCANTELRRLATVDALTQLANRRRFDEGLDREWRRASRASQNVSLLLCDVDFFKGYNDHYGHLAGDDCLRQVARALTVAARRPSDLVARYGGEEFAVLMPDAEVEGALTLAWRIQEVLADLRIPHAKSVISEFLTISIGVASLVPAPDAPGNRLIAAADKGLFAAKRQGRNTCCLWAPAAQKPLPGNA